MSQIDWSKAPEWASVFLGPACGAGNCAWAESFSDGAQFALECGSMPTGRIKLIGYHNWKLISERPAAAQWNGTGLPPVGVVCEIEHHREWVRCEILAHKTFNDLPGLVHAIAWIDKDTVDQSSGIRFRPIRTPEQIAADEREAAIEEIEELIAGYSYRHCAEQIYQAGYRKQSTKQDDQQ